MLVEVLRVCDIRVLDLRRKDIIHNRLLVSRAHNNRTALKPRSGCHCKLMPQPQDVAQLVQEHVLQDLVVGEGASFGGLGCLVEAIFVDEHGLEWLVPREESTGEHAASRSAVC